LSSEIEGLDHIIYKQQIWDLLAISVDIERLDSVGRQIAAKVKASWVEPSLPGSTLKLQKKNTHTI
jgi:hypothetical protein